MSQKQQNRVEQELLSPEDEASVTAPSSSSTLDSPEPETTQDSPEPETIQETEQAQSSLVVSGKKRGKKKGRLVNAEEIMPKPSYWPLALAVSFVLLMMGIMISWIVIGVGAVLVIASVMGWSLERR